MKNAPLFLLGVASTFLVSVQFSFACPETKDVCDVPFVARRFDTISYRTEQIRNLTADNFSIQLSGSPVQPVSVSLDDSPKRTLLLIDARTSVPHEEWGLQTSMAAYVANQGRPEDHFILALVGCDDAPKDFNPQAAIEQLRSWESSRPASNGDERLYDALVSAARRLDPSRFGDTIFLFGHPEDSASKASAGELRDLLLKKGIRLFGLSFKDPLREKFPNGFDPNKPMPRGTFPELSDVSLATGAFYSFHSLESLKHESPSLFKAWLASIYEGISEPYRVTLPMAGRTGLLDLRIALKNYQSRVNPGDIHHPMFVYSCDTQPKPSH
jgi:hypothetical protein